MRYARMRKLYLKVNATCQVSLPAAFYRLLLFSIKHLIGFDISDSIIWHTFIACDTYSDCTICFPSWRCCRGDSQFDEGECLCLTPSIGEEGWGLACH